MLFYLLVWLSLSATSGFRRPLRLPALRSNIQMITPTYSPADIGKAGLDWPNLGFVYRQTNSFVVSEYADGEWGPVQSRKDPYVSVHIGSTALHYGQACFEGLKAFHCRDGRVRIFRPKDNAARIAKSCRRICMPEIREALFLSAVRQAVRENLAFLPPYGSNGALYIRPVVFGSGPRIGLQPSDRYTFVVLVIPAADYYLGGWNPVQAVVVSDYDRAAPRGVGNVKVAGNYAADILPNMNAKKSGFPIALYLDSKTNSLIEEFSTSNFVAIDRKGAFVTPKSDAILESITNKSLMQIAADEGRDVQVRNVEVKELVDGRFTEIGACGTAVVLTPIDRIMYDKHVVALDEKEPTQSVLRGLYLRIRRIQNGEEPDKFHWLLEL